MRLSTSFFAVLTTWWARVTRSRTTLAFFLFVLVNYAAQTALHLVVLLSYERDRKLVTDAIDAANVQRGFAMIQNGVVEICYGVPYARGTLCHTVGGPSLLANTVPTNVLSMQCAEGLTWLENYLRNTRSEGAVVLIFQGWLAVNSLIALLDESIPHLIVVLAAQVVSTTWISYLPTSDEFAKNVYNEVIVNGTCGNFDILDGSWQHSEYYVALGFSVAALLGVSFFVFKLVKLYSTATLSSVGSSPVVNQLLKWRLWMRVFILFSVFFIITSAAVWFDERRSDILVAYSQNPLDDAGFYAVVVILWPWMALGRHSVSTEKRHLFLIYAFLSICLLLISGLWFGSPLFRYEYMEWRFFACVTTLADVLLVTTCIVSLICRVNFGKGLAQFLDVERALRVAGFAQDTFMRDPSKRDPTESSFTTTSERPELLSSPVIDITNPHRSHPPSKHPSTSVYSIGSAASVYTAWLTSQGSREKGRLQVPNLKGERLSSTVTISKENMRPHSDHSSFFSDDESDISNKDDKKDNVTS